MSYKNIVYLKILQSFFGTTTVIRKRGFWLISSTFLDYVFSYFFWNFETSGNEHFSAN